MIISVIHIGRSGGALHSSLTPSFPSLHPDSLPLASVSTLYATRFAETITQNYNYGPFGQSASADERAAGALGRAGIRLSSPPLIQTWKDGKTLGGGGGGGGGGDGD